MQINRHNYEQYFLLYADGELTTSQRNAVQEFVDINKDLAIELTMIQAAVLPKDEVSFLDKSFLLKGIDQQIQEKLLLKLDNELPAKELAAIDALILNNSTAKAEYDLLAKTNLDKNEKIIFEHKHLLYKKEKDNIIPFGYLRWAAAAIFIGIVLFTGIKLYNNKTSVEPAIAGTGKENKVERKTQNAIENSISTNDTTNNTAKANEKFIVPKQNNKQNIITNTAEIKLENETQKNVNNKNIVTNSIKERITNNKDEKAVNDNPNNFIAKEEFVLPQVNNTTQQNQNTIANNASTQKAINTERLYELENTYAYQNVVQKVEDNTENKIFYVNESKVKKSKVGMFFSKLKTAVQKTAKVKAGSSIQIAGFEISGN